MKPRVLIAEPLDFTPAAVDLLRTETKVVLQQTDAAQLPQAFAEFDVVWTRLANRITTETLGASPRCRILASATTGLDHIDLEACERSGIRVISLRGEVDFLREVRATAEFTLALALSLLRHLPAAAAAGATGQWDRDPLRGREVYEKTVGIVGVGRLGSIVAGYFRAMGARVIGYDPRHDFPDDAAERVTELNRLAEQSDIVCVMAKYDATTRGLIGREFLESCKSGAMLVNTARGGIVDESALLDALRSGKLAGAALDVLDGEPAITPEHPLVAYARLHSNVLITPHLGGNTFESFVKTETFLARKVLAALGETIR